MRSFARIHESNLKKQGILALTFGDPADYDEIREGDTLDLVGLAELAENRPVECVARHPDGEVTHLELRHSYTEAQLAWFRTGSALNAIGQGAKAGDRAAPGDSVQRASAALMARIFAGSTGGFGFARHGRSVEKDVQQPFNGGAAQPGANADGCVEQEASKSADIEGPFPRRLDVLLQGEKRRETRLDLRLVRSFR